MKKQLVKSVFLLLACISLAEEPKLLSLKPVTGMIRADLYSVETVSNPKAVIVLSPGCNGNGAGLVGDPQWQVFAKHQQMGLVGLSFASEINNLQNGTGYYYVTNGSGRLLLDGIRKLFGHDLPLVLYGFSGGAQFASRFVEWEPKRIITWCAYSAGWWDEPRSSIVTPPGIIACGEKDERLGASLIYFKQGRAKGRPWLWISIPNNGHSPDGRVESFVRDYFAEILKAGTNVKSNRSGIWLDIDTKVEVERIFAEKYPSVTAWLPNAELLGRWQSLYKPQQ